MCFLGSLSLAVFHSPLINYAVIRPLVRGRSRSLKMAPSDRPYTTLLVDHSIVLSGTIFKLFGAE